MRKSMNDIWMDLASNLSHRSTCQRLQVGAVITDKYFERVYAVGYNGGAKHQKNECESLEPGKCGHLHAEINALIKCQVNDKEKMLFVTTFPCSVCAKAIVNSGFKTVYYHNEYREGGAHPIFNLARINIIQI